MTQEVRLHTSWSRRHLSLSPPSPPVWEVPRRPRSRLKQNITIRFCSDVNSFQLSEGSADVPAAAWVSSFLFPLKDGVAADPNRLEEEVLEGMKEKLDGVGLDPKEARTELSTF